MEKSFFDKIDAKIKKLNKKNREKIFYVAFSFIAVIILIIWIKLFFSKAF